MNTPRARVLIMAGGTGGHVYPGLAVARELLARGCEVAWLGTAAGLEAKLVPDAGIELHFIQVRGLRGNGLFGWLAAPVAIAQAVLEAASVLARWRPTVVLGLGGFASGPGGLAATLKRIPLVVHEQNARPGLTNRVLAKIATRVLDAFPNSLVRSKDALVCGNPVRAEIAAVAQYIAPRENELRRVLVIGGSQGATFLNESVPQAIARLESSPAVNVVHQCGAAHAQATRASYAIAGVEATVVPYLENMTDAFAAAHLVIARSGAMTVTELAACGRPAFLVPYPYAVDDHQMHNANYLVQRGAAKCCAQTSLSVAEFASELSALINSPETLADMALAARAAFVPNADVRVADHCCEVAK